MSYKALLFCPDEVAARLVTQVLSELEFTVELSFETFATVKKLGEEPFDALVVDCNDEQNASVLFKGARSSTVNHSSLCVAVAEGQAGVAKAFKIGANLVLTKPINIEQSKNTLRVAKGLLRKNAPAGKPSAGTQSHTEGSGAATTGIPSLATHSSAVAPGSTPAPVMSSAPPSLPNRSAGMASSLLEAEQLKAPAAEPAPKPATAPSFNSSLPSFGTSTGAAAAPALAREKSTLSTEPRVPEIRTAPPLATHDPIFADAPTRLETEPSVPSILSYAQRPEPRTGGSKAVWIIACVLLVGVAGFFGWRKFQPMRYVHIGASPSNTGSTAASAQPQTLEAKPADGGAISVEQPATTAPTANTGESNSTAATVSSTSASSAPEGFPTKERIDISAPAETQEPEVTVTPAPKPLQVSKKSPKPAAVQQPLAAPAPPSLALPSSNTSDSTLSGLVATNVVLPKPTPGTLRISQGITQGLLVKRVPPAYPLAALQMRKEGGVDLLATISKTGAISRVQVLSGDAMLAKSAVDAVRQWKYRPYLLNGEPVEIETQITVLFKLPH